ncbi:hypothetical protein TanjilG_24710 [Lupinus angustifolius]|uniref:Uncharacterized protein n=1 Tax=Lupinus angustifolius TaxID=3871 RepID=A0A4P1RKE0_LUPAN|nr:PREDICTED: uncharacterized protein LOC109346512 [Lupinus angustifolius]OIW12777.1 hypothetical protein TanjilG_24710 [Lupinus angustifolius]
MAKIASSSSSSPYLQLSIPFPLFSSHHTTHKPFFLFTTRATEPETPPSDSDPTRPETDDFDNRINQLRIRNRSGIGKKAEIRKGRKSKKTSSSSSGGVFLPSVPLKEPVSDGLKVELGFTSYSERLNGRIAILGLAALLLVELATGKGVIKYHTPSIILIQIYFVAAVSALYVKYEKEKNSVWPTS